MKNYCLLSFLGGVALGAVVALLLAPDSGENTRQKIGDKLRQGERKITDAIEQEVRSEMDC